MKDINENLEWIKIDLDKEKSLYMFPSSLTLIEYDRQFDSFLKDFNNGRDFKNLPYPKHYIEDNLYNMEVLKKEGFFTPLTVEPLKKVPIKRVIIANTLSCNMACTYCYNKFESNKDGLKEKDMSEETFEKVIEFLEHNGKNLPGYELLFIGGEPLMNRAILEKAAEWKKTLEEKGKTLFLSVTTNTTLLTEEMIDFCIKSRIYLKITLEGNQKEHDKHRIFPDGTGTYKKIIELLPSFFYKYDNPYKYVVTTLDTLVDDPEEKVIFMSAMGFNIIDLTEIYPGIDTKKTEEELERIYREKYRRLLSFLRYRIRSRNYIHIVQISSIINNIHFHIPLFYPCRAGIDSLSVSPDGTIYACHHFFGDRRFILGSVYDKIFNKNTLAPYRITVEERSECRECPARLVCGGPCYHRCLAVTGDISLCNRKECIRKKALLKEIIIFYNELKKSDYDSFHWFINKGKEF
ncbi:MAG: radical SAM protein [Candidatus Eremiobacterota bacterium]